MSLILFPFQFNFQKGFVAILAVGMTAGLVVIPQLATWELRLTRAAFLNIL